MTIATQPGRGAVRRALTSVGGVFVGSAILCGAVAPMATAATPEPASPAATASATSSVVEVDAAFTPEQQETLAAVLNSPQGRAQIARSLGEVSPTAPGTVSPLAQGGKDGDHWWIKISMAEIAGTGIGAACRAAFPQVSWFVCGPLGAAVQQAVARWPHAGGVWAELYTDGRIRIGTW